MYDSILKSKQSLQLLPELATHVFIRSVMQYEKFPTPCWRISQADSPPSTAAKCTMDVVSTQVAEPWDAI